MGLNASYLSKLFRKETGKTITDYLTDARIEKAKRILEDYSDVRMYEVGSLVGYPDPMYFTKLFKKHVGMAPKEYQDSAGNSQSGATSEKYDATQTFYSSEKTYKTFYIFGRIVAGFPRI